MDAMYSLSGSVVVRDCPESRAIAEEIRGNFEECVSVLDHGDTGRDDGRLVLEFGGAQRMTYGSVFDLDDLVKSLGPFVEGDPQFVDYDCDGGRGVLIVGDLPPGKSAASLAARRSIERIGFADLDDEDAAEISALLAEGRDPVGFGSLCVAALARRGADRADPT